MMKRSFADILQGLDSDRAQKVARKLPAWAAAGAEIPSALALEQCSSAATACYKAELAVAVVSANSYFSPDSAGQAATAAKLRAARYPSQPGGWAPPVHEATGGHGIAAVPPAPACKDRINTVLDLTGGLGVDSWAFSQVAERVVYFERNEELVEAARRNFARLGADNIELRCETVTPETELPEADLIYADPARRDAAGRKVFLLEDCTPDILTLLPMLLRKAPAVLLKLSPMADLTMLAERLGPALQEIHVVELDGEVKELLCLLRRDDSPAEPAIVVVQLSGQAAASELHTSRSGELPPETSTLTEPPDRARSPWKGVQGVEKKPACRLRFPEAVAADVPIMKPTFAPENSLRFRLSEEREAEARYAAEVRPGDVLLEPCAALLKAGAFRLPSARWNLLKLAPSTHLYLLPGTEKPSSAPGESIFYVPGTETPHSAPGNHFFKARTVKEVLPLGAAAFKDLRKRFPRAEVTARNLPLGSAELQKKLGIPPGGDVHIFGCRLSDNSHVLIITDTSPASDSGAEIGFPANLSGTK